MLCSRDFSNARILALYPPNAKILEIPFGAAEFYKSTADLMVGPVNPACLFERHGETNCLRPLKVRHKETRFNVTSIMRRIDI